MDKNFQSKKFCNLPDWIFNPVCSCLFNLSAYVSNAVFPPIVLGIEDKLIFCANRNLSPSFRPIDNQLIISQIFIILEIKRLMSYLHI